MPPSAERCRYPGAVLVRLQITAGWPAGQPAGLLRRSVGFRLRQPSGQFPRRDIINPGQATPPTHDPAPDATRCPEDKIAT